MLLSHPAARAAAEPKAAWPVRPWVELMRMERWGEALALVESEPEAVQKDPLVRLAKGVAARRVNAFERSLSALNALDGELPELSERVLRVRAEASLAAGDFRQAELYYRARSDAASRLRAAEALAKLGERDAARTVIDALLKKLPARSRCSVEAPARRLRATLLADNAVAAAAAEYRWLLLEAPLCESSEGVEEQLDALPETYRLKPSERLTRARQQLSREQRMSAELEEVVVHADAIEIEQLRPDLRERCFSFGALRDFFGLR